MLKFFMQKSGILPNGVEIMCGNCEVSIEKKVFLYKYFIL